MITSSTEGVHEPLEIVQRSTFAPTDKPETDVVGKSAFEKVPVPETTLQSPLPMLGAFANRFVTVEQTCWSMPAFELVGFC
jgi:hypothetical protein